MMKVLIAGLFLFLGGLVSAQVVINEVDADQVSTDSAEFVELYGAPNQSLDGLVLVFFNGSNDQSYQAFDLDGHSLDADGFFVLCGDATNVVPCDLEVAPATNLIQNGADAVAVFLADATDFPNGSPVTDTNLVDALVYGTDDPADAGLLDVLTPGQSQVDEDADGNKDGHANARVPDGGTPRVTSTYVQQPPTPGAANGGTPPEPTVVLNEWVANHTGTDTHEFLELLGEPATDYSALTFVELEGDAGDGPGTVASVYPVGTTDADGYWTTGFLKNTLGGGTKTLLLVADWSGTVAADLDTDDDGVLDLTPWTEIVDAVAVSDAEAGDQTYALPVLDTTFGGGFAPGGASRIPNGTDTDTEADWTPNDFDGAGLPGFPGTLTAGEALNTPGAANTTQAPPRVVLNEFVADHTGADTHQYLEVYGSAMTDFSTWTLLQLDGETQPGQVLGAWPLGSTNAGGYWDTGFLNAQLQTRNFSLLLVSDFTGMAGDDLDTDDDGTLDVTPWTTLYDGVAAADTTPGVLLYADVVLGDGFGGLAGTPGGASRLPNGTDTDTPADWTRNDFEGTGLPGFEGNLEPGEAVNTPGAFNTDTAPGEGGAVINEWVANHTGSDDHEYIEVLGDPEASYAHLTLVVLHGDAETGPGVIAASYQVGDTDTDGYWVTGFLTNELGNGSQTLLLVDGYVGTTGTDLDTNDDGTLDGTPWSAVLDDVAVTDGGAGDRTYSATVLAEQYDGMPFTPGGASRWPDGTDTDTQADWLRNDFYGAGLPGFGGSVEPGEARNTPGAVNSDQPPPGAGALLSEFNADHVGTDTHEFVELWGMPGTSYATTTVLVLDGAASGNPGQVAAALAGGTTDSDGFWASAFQNEVLPNGSISLLVVVGFSGSAGDDLDTDDDGTLDVTPWTQLQDSVAVDMGGAGDRVYSDAVLGGALRGTGAPGGASRYPYYQDTDSAADWRPNDFDGAGLPGFAGNVTSGEAFHTPGRVSVVDVADYYAGISTAADLRTQLHTLISGHLRFPYTDSFSDTWDLLEVADEDPLDAGAILSLYKNAPYPKQGGGNAFYNREHTWAKSFGFPDDTPDAMPYTDAHHLMLADSVYNSTRNNLAFGTCDAGCSEAPTTAYAGRGGGSGVYPGNSNWYRGSGGTGTFEVWHGRRGDVARALLYMDVRYAGDTHPVTGAAEPDLILTDDTGLITTTGTNTPGPAYLGRLTTLLQWHLDDPVDDLERARNEVVYRYQGNRNPFVDHPEWMACVFEDDCPGGVTPCIAAHYPDWTQAAAPCSGAAALTVRDLIALLAGTCPCE